MPAGLDYLVNGGLVSPKLAQALHYLGIALVLAGVIALLFIAMDIRTTQQQLGCAAVCVCEDIRSGFSYYAPYSNATLHGEEEPPDTYTQFLYDQAHSKT